ncbi:MAG TPA: SBBP repeat-containing protein [Candidatus Deferrimicrobiaceae bacterium]|nr:SBBP repeat-containing protein [Candidatus Deferrimicrobiaceae bacterium]
MGNGCEVSGKSLSASAESRLKSIRVMGAAVVLVLVACVMLGSGSRRYAQKAMTPTSGFPVPAILGKAPLKSNPDARALLGQLPLIFEPNQGQTDPSVKFVSRGAGYSLFLDATGAVLAMRTEQPASTGRSAASRSGSENAPSMESVRMTLVGSNPAAAIAGSDLLPGRSNYFIGNDPKKWHTGVPQFAGVHYQNVYPGIDLVFYGSQGRLEYDFKVAPGADPSQAELKFDGATKLELSHGDLILKGTGASVRLQAPRVYQSVAGRQQPVDGRFVLRAANRVGFEIGAYDRGRALVIDPTVSYSTYFGGSGSETYPSIAVNGDGFIYLAGSTTSTDLPVASSPVTPFQSTLNGAQNIFILKLDPTAGASGILYLTYLGGSGTDISAGLAVDTSGTAFVTGTTTSTNFPTSPAGFQTTPLAGTACTPLISTITVPCHVFVSALSGLDTTGSTPQLKYSTYLSGNGSEAASALATDNNGNVFVTGTTTSTIQKTGFPSTLFPPAYQQASQGSIQFFVTEVNTKNATGLSSIQYSTYFGGSNGSIAVGGGIAVDTTGNVYFSGTTNFYNSGEGPNGGVLNSSDFPILNAYQPCLNTPPPVTILPPVTCPAVTATPELTDAFMAKLNVINAQTGGTQLIFSTYLGGSNNDSSTGLTIDTGAASIYLTGTTNSPDITVPTGAGQFQPCLNAPTAVLPCSTTPNTTNTDAYVARFTNETESTTNASVAVPLSYFSYLGGSLNDSGLSIAVDTAGGALVTGATNSTDFPASIGAIQTHLLGAQNAFFAHIDTTISTGQNAVGSYATYFGGNGTDRGTSITVDPSLNSYFAGDTNSTDLQVQGAVQNCLDTPVNPAPGTPCPTITAPAPTDAFAVRLETATDLCIRCVAPLLSPASGLISAGNQITITFTVINEGPDLATNVNVTGQLSAGITAVFNSATAASGTCSVPTGGSNVVCTIPALQSGSTATVAMVVTPSTAGGGSILATVTNSNNTNTSNTVTAAFTATDFSISILPSSQTVVAGNTATYSVFVSPSLTFGANVSLSCSSLPAGASCGFTPSTLTFNGPGQQSSTLNVTTTVRPISTISSTRWSSPFYALWLMVPGAALFGLGSGKRRRSRLLGFFLLWTVFSLIVLLPSCSKAKEQPTITGTPAGTYAGLSVTATSGSLTKSAGFSLTVQ